MYPAVSVANEKPITPHSPCSNHAGIMKLFIIRRTHYLLVCQSLILLRQEHPSPEITEVHMEYAIITLLYLGGFLVVGFCLFQVAGVLDKLVDENKALNSDKV